MSKRVVARAPKKSREVLEGSPMKIAAEAEAEAEADGQPSCPQSHVDNAAVATTTYTTDRAAPVAQWSLLDLLGGGDDLVLPIPGAGEEWDQWDPQDPNPAHTHAT